jgi:hypothetical protein
MSMPSSARTLPKVLTRPSASIAEIVTLVSLSLSLSLSLSSLAVQFPASL